MTYLRELKKLTSNKLLNDGHMIPNGKTKADIKKFMERKSLRMAKLKEKLTKSSSVKLQND